MTLKLVIRNLLKRPILNLIKIMGLSLALCGSLLIILFLKYELTFDTFNTNYDRVFRLTVADNSVAGGMHFARIPNAGIVPVMAEYFPEINSFVRLAPVRGGVLKYKENFILINQAFECDSTFFQVFNCRLESGNPENLLNSPGSMVVSESFARRVFGKNDPSGEILILPAGQFYGKNVEFTVRGVIKDFPGNSHFHPEFVVSPLDRSILDGWAWSYLLLEENAGPEKIISGFKDFFTSSIDNKADLRKIEPHLQRLTDIHLNSNKLREIEPNGNMSVIYAFSIAALILLFTAIANYANLNIAMAGFSDGYLFISKVCGASRWMIVKYFIYEGVFIVSGSILIGGFLSFLAGILINNQYGLRLLNENLPLISITLVIFLCLTLLSGFLPVIKSGFESIRGTSNKSNQNAFRRKGISKGIIVIQYTISVALIVAVFVIHRQTDYALEQGMGYKNNNLICLKDVHTDVQKKFEVFKAELLKNNSVKSVSAMFEPPGGEANDMFEFKMEGYVGDETNRRDNYIRVFPCDYSFASIFALKIIAGYNFSGSNIDNEGSGEYLINETAMKRLHYTNPSEIIGKSFRILTNIEGVSIPAGKITGVVEDFHLSGIKKTVEPLVLFKRNDLWLINFVISFDEGDRKKAISEIRGTWETLFPGYPFQYEYVGSIYEDVYKTELLQVRLLSVFTVMALFICLMGMLGLTLLTTQRRTKEIGIRKINGAGTAEVMLMLNMDLLRWILLSIILALPFAWYAMDKWLENFAYRIPLSWWIYLAAGLSAFIITFITVSVQSWRASRRNPVETLKYE